MKISQPIAGLCLTALLSACGGGGGDAAPAPTNPTNPSVLTGVFVDSPVSGISYTTATQSGKTNAKGEFSYVAGEKVTFSIGSVQLPMVLANATVTPLDIAKTTDINNQVASNIMVLLQSLDEDGTPANGISIPAGAAAKAITPINFDVAPTVFAANAAVTGLVANSGSITKTPIAAAAAKAHFQSTLSGTGGATKVNVAPVANAGTVQSVLTGAVVTLDGSTSSDANNDTLTYVWTLTTKPTGSAAALSSATSAKPTFSADMAGSYIASLVVNDGTVNSTATTVTVTSSTANAAPVANAGVAQNVVAGSTVTLNGAASSDANGDALTYAWTLTSKPVGSTATLASANVVSPTFVADKAGSYVAMLTVNDSKLNSAAATITVTAAVANVAPVANAGVAQNVVAGSLVTLDGGASSDANGDSLTYAWTLTSKPAGSTAALSSATSAKPTLTADVAAGTYVATLVVTDGKLLSASATVTITVVPRIVGALGLSLTDSYQFCGMNGTFSTISSNGTSNWTINNCAVFGSAGSTIWARIQNNGSTPLQLTQIYLFNGQFGKTWSISPTSQTIAAGAAADFGLPLWLGMEITNATATFTLQGETPFVVPLTGGMKLL
jgi:hypothetical protein